MFGTINHAERLVKSLKDLLISGKNSDIALVVEGKIIPVHRNILAHQCGFFQKLFYETELMESQMHEVPIEAPLASFESVLQYMYSGSLAVLDKRDDELMEILELAHRFELSALEDSLLDVLISMVNLKNVRKLFQAADLLNSEKLLRKCCEVLADGEYLNHKDFLTITDKEVHAIFSCKFLKITNMSKFNAIAKWIQSNDCTEEVKKKLLDAVDLTKLTNKQLIQDVVRTKLIQTEVIIGLVDSRQADVPKEIIQRPVQTPDSSVIVGFTVSFGTLTDDSIVAEIVNDEHEIILSAKPRGQQIDYLSFDLGTERLFDYSIYTTTKSDPFSQSGWEKLVSYYNCSRKQKILFSGKLVKYLKVNGIAKLRSFMWIKPNNNFLSQNLPVNLIKPETAYVGGSTNDQLLRILTMNLKSNGLTTPYCSIPHEGITIRFNQPQNLRRIRIRLWDFDGRKQSFNLFSVLNSPIGFPEKKDHIAEDSMGWINFVVPVGMYEAIKIHPKMGDKELLLAYLEVSATFKRV